jgi:hypothetical protein
MVDELPGKKYNGLTKDLYKAIFSNALKSQKGLIERSFEKANALCYFASVF